MLFISYSLQLNNLVRDSATSTKGQDNCSSKHTHKHTRINARAREKERQNPSYDDLTFLCFMTVSLVSVTFIYRCDIRLYPLQKSRSRGSSASVMYLCFCCHSPLSPHPSKHSIGLMSPENSQIKDLDESLISPPPHTHTQLLYVHKVKQNVFIHPCQVVPQATTNSMVMRLQEVKGCSPKPEEAFFTVQL